MALAITSVIKPQQIGDRYMAVVKVDFDSSYPVGGESLLRSDLGFLSAADDEFHVTTDPTKGYIFRYDHTNQKLMAYTQFKTYTATYDPAALAATTARDDAITVTGVAATDVVIGYQAAPALTAGLSIQEARVSAANTITVRLNNASAGSIDGASGTWTFYVTPANGALAEVADTTDLSAVTGVRVTAYGRLAG